jgi:hypothetical protein
MSLLKNITPSSIILEMYNTPTPEVNYVPVNVVLSLEPGQSVSEQSYLVSDISDPSFNQNIINSYIAAGILSRLPGN